MTQPYDPVEGVWGQGPWLPPDGVPKLTESGVDETHRKRKVKGNPVAKMRFRATQAVASPTIRRLDVLRAG